jgi:alpha-galactosidase
MDSSPERLANIHSRIAGINHMAWLLDITENGKDIYPELRKAGERKLKTWLKAKKEDKPGNMIRVAMMKHFGYYVTESSEHNAEYAPFWIKSNYPELIDRWNIPLDEYLRRCVLQIDAWKEEYRKLKENASTLGLKKSHEYGSGIMNAIYTNTPYQIGGNVLNTGLITNLPSEAVVEVPCLVDGSGIQGTYVGALPTQCAAMNVTNINVQLLTVEAALTLNKERIYQAAMMDPHTAAELSIDDIVKMCDDLIDAHGNMLPKYK